MKVRVWGKGEVGADMEQHSCECPLLSGGAVVGYDEQHVLAILIFSL